MRRTIRITLALTGSAVILAAVLALVGWRATIEAVRAGGVTAFLVSGLFLAVQVFLQAVGLHILSHAVGHRVPLWGSLRAVATGLGAGVLLPGGYVAAEPVKVVYLRATTGLPAAELAGTVLLSKYLEVISFAAVVALTGIAALPCLGLGVSGDGRHLSPALFGVLSGLAGVGMIGLLVFLERRHRPLTATARGLARVLRGRPSIRRLAENTAVMEDWAGAAFLRHRVPVFLSLASFLVFHGMVILRPAAVFALGWGIGLTLSQLSVIFLVTQLLHAAQVTPSGVGTLDGGLLATLAVVDLSIRAPQCAAFLLYLRFWDAALAGIACLFALRAGVRLLGARDAAARPIPLPDGQGGRRLGTPYSAEGKGDLRGDAK
ncbi:MAG: flippase-like domain-containing protein [Lentisphaeria bacterium]|nr:flippase-like domain-containing protein [Lentisphaeria bacterium]